ncbi:methyl-accepting chemotaxis protein [uncultured Roseobacter sp.]|uniref:methyl-accepting chemotaxis protein n=1 Tax=uncultured Roseobacter sp. TaxID=114847 RepID=UPI00262BCF17|nr:methyl-accepting chemotaxis protein [uncultured Roseobacter sp.]
MTYSDRVRGLADSVLPLILTVFRRDLGEGKIYFLVAAALTTLLPFLFVIQAPREFWYLGKGAFFVSLAIFLVFTLLSLYLAAVTLVKFAAEYRYAIAIFRLVRDDLQTLDGDDEALGSDDVRPPRYVPAEARNSICAKLVVKYYDTARALRSDDGIAKQVIEAELAGHRGNLRPLSGFALRIGILLTFFGLLFGLAPVGAALDEKDITNIPIGQLLSGLTVSFASSIAGLAAALVIGIMGLAIENAFQKLRGAIEDLALALRQLFSRVRFGGDLSQTVDHLTSEMRNHAREMESHGVQVERTVTIASEAFRDHTTESARIMQAVARSTDDLSELSNRHRAQIDRIAEATNSLHGFEEKWADHFRKMLEDNATVARDHAADLANSLATDLGTIREAMVESMAEDRSQLSDTIVALSKSNTQVGATLDQLQGESLAREADLTAAISALTRELKTMAAKDKAPKRKRKGGWVWVLILLGLTGAALYGGFPLYAPLIEEMAPGLLEELGLRLQTPT